MRFAASLASTMGMDSFSERAEQARRGQWRLPDLPWDEPIKLPGASARERLLCKFDLIEACDAIYHLKLGARVRMGYVLMQSWNSDPSLVECLEWLDTDELRHLRVLRKLQTALRTARHEGPESDRSKDLSRMWRVGRTLPTSTGIDEASLRMLADESATHCLLLAMSRQSRVPLARAVFASCAKDDNRHATTLVAMLASSLGRANPARIIALQTALIAHIARLQSALRPSFPTFAAVTGSTNENIASEIFHAISHRVSELGPAWVRYPTARMIHAADRSPWMLWLLR